MLNMVYMLVKSALHKALTSFDPKTSDPLHLYHGLLAAPSITHFVSDHISRKSAKACYHDGVTSD